MSFEEQERALFDLLFDRKLRRRFCEKSVVALSGYRLDDSERKDFSQIRTDALELDAWMRADLVLSHLCRSFPLGFSIASSLDQGMEMLRDLVDTGMMRTPPLERTPAFGARLRERLAAAKFPTAAEQAAALAVAEAELGMAWTSSTLKREVVEHGAPERDKSSLADDWLNKPVALAPYVCASTIPQSYQQLKDTLCPGTEPELWQHLSRTALPASLRTQALRNEDPKLLVTRAHVTHASRCEPVVAQVTVELSEGFVSLFQHVDGSMSVGQILAHFKHAGAPDRLIQSVHLAFQQLLQTGMLRCQ